MKVSDFNYNLPKELIAQVPIKNRDESRLMVLDRKNKIIENKIFKDIIDYLEPGDCLVRNNTKVIPARLYGIKQETGAHIEFLLLNISTATKHTNKYRIPVEPPPINTLNNENAKKNLAKTLTFIPLFTIYNKLK